MLYEKLKELGFKFDSNPQEGPAYIMSDGKFLHLFNNKDLLEISGNMFASHTQLDVFVIENNLVPSDALINRVLCETDNAVRVNDGTNVRAETLIGLPNNQLTESQYSSLEDWLYSIMTKRSSIAVGNDNSTNIFKVYNFDEYLPEEIIKRIKRYYSTGKLLDSFDNDKGGK